MKRTLKSEENPPLKLSASAGVWMSDREGRSFDTSELKAVGPVAAKMMLTDPIYFAIYCARYKFVAKMLKQVRSVAEVGCGDGYGTVFLAEAAEHVEAFDIDEVMLADCQRRLSYRENLRFSYHDFVFATVPSLSEAFDAVVMVDVLEHIHSDEEELFLRNITDLLNPQGFAIIGTPNIEANKWASERSRATHINLKSGDSLRGSLSSHFGRVLLFGQNDEVLHTGFEGMCHYLWAICFAPHCRK